MSLRVMTLLLLVAPSLWSQAPEKNRFDPTNAYAVRKIEGWTVRVNQRLVAQEKLAEETLRLLESHLYQIRRVVPAAALEKLRAIEIWVEDKDRCGSTPCMCYHVSKGWLVANGYNPDKAKGVAIENAQNFLTWTRQQPFMVLHELAHGYHDRVFGYDDEKILAAYREAKKAGNYEKVRHINGTERRHYALTNQMEYFAEGTEAFFGTNDFFPFVNAELREHDPKLHRVLSEVWGTK